MNEQLQPLTIKDLEKFLGWWESADAPAEGFQLAGIFLIKRMIATLERYETTENLESIQKLMTSLGIPPWYEFTTEKGWHDPDA